MIHSDCQNVVDLGSYRNNRVRELVHTWPEDWAEPAQRMPFTLEWLPAWFALAEVVAAERRRAAEAEGRAHP
jgi:hypothetical protein